MEIRIDSLIEGANRAEGTVVIVDVFRAFTTEAVAFSRGADKIILVARADDALELRRRGVVDLCMGEIAGMRPEGFDLGNSPFEVSLVDLKGRTLAHSTQAGTVGVNSAPNADRIYGGSFVLAKATAKAITRHNPDLVTIVAMGDGGRLRVDEDEQCALYLRNLLQGRAPDCDAVRALVLAGEQSQKYDDPALPHFHPDDRRIALEIDIMPFAIQVQCEDGMLVSRPEVV